MLRMEFINLNNFNTAVKIQEEIFPEYSAKLNYYKSIIDDSQNKFFMVYDGSKCVGISGIYTYSKDKENAWIGFLGVRKKYRKNGYGNQILEMTEDYAKSLGYKYIRLFTDRHNNDHAIAFYAKSGYIFEGYDCDQEEVKDKFSVVIGSKTLCDKPVKPWNNKFINLTKQTIKQGY